MSNSPRKVMCSPVLWIFSGLKLTGSDKNVRHCSPIRFLTVKRLYHLLIGLRRYLMIPDQQTRLWSTLSTLPINSGTSSLWVVNTTHPRQARHSHVLHGKSEGVVHQILQDAGLHCQMVSRVHESLYNAFKGLPPWYICSP